jgi:hypothetical protein
MINYIMKLFVVCIVGLCALSLFGLLSCRDPNAPKIPETSEKSNHLKMICHFP